MNKDDRAGLQDILESLSELRDRIECVKDDIESAMGA